MSDNNQLIYEQTIIVSELLIKVTTLENILLSKGLIDSADVVTETKKVVAKLTELVRQNAKDVTSTSNSNN